MKLSIMFLCLTFAGQIFAAAPMLGQESDPVGGDQSRCCKSGLCGDLKKCADTGLYDSRKSGKETALKAAPGKKKKGSASVQ